MAGFHDLLTALSGSSLHEDAVHDGRPEPIYTASADEKPEVQAIGRDDEYIRHDAAQIATI